MRPPRALLFDLDDTLLDPRELQRAVLQTCTALAAAEGLDAPRLLEANAEVWRTYWPEAERKWMLGILDGATVSLQVWQRTLSACGCLDESIARSAVEAHSAYTREAYRLYEDALELLVWLSGRLALGLITNGAGDTQREKLLWFGLERYFDVIAISGEIGAAKPDAELFRFALDKLAISPEDAWYVGDNLYSDVAGAKAAQLTAVWLNRNGAQRNAGDPEPDLEVVSLMDLLTVVAGMQEQRERTS